MASIRAQSTTSTDFPLIKCDDLSSLDMRKVVLSPDNYVQWKLVLRMSPDKTKAGFCLVSLEANSETVEAPHEAKHVNAVVQLSVTVPPAGGFYVCMSCNPGGLLQTLAPCKGLYLNCPLRTGRVLAEQRLGNNFFFKISVSVPVSSFTTGTSTQTGKTVSTLPLTVTLTHFQTVKEDTPSRGGPAVTQHLKTLLDSGDMSDVTFVVGGEELRAHSQILGAVSDVFRAMFSHDTEDRRSGRVAVVDAEVAPFKEMLRCVYTGALPTWTEGEHSDDFLMGLFSLAEKYNLEALRNECHRRVLCTMTVANAVERIKALQIVNPDVVPLVADPFVRTHLNEILASDAWTSLMTEDVALAAYVMYNAMLRC